MKIFVFTKIICADIVVKSYIMIYFRLFSSHSLHRSLIPAIFSLFIILYVFSSCKFRPSDEIHVEKNQNVLFSDSLLKIIKESVIRHDYENSLKYAYELKSYSEQSEDRKAYLSGMVYIGQSYLCLGQIDSMSVYLDKSLEIAKEQNDYWALATVHNALGVYHLFNLMDYSGAIEFLYEGIRYAKLCNDENRLFVLKSNLSLAYYLRKDPAGWEYAIEVYQLGHKYQDSYMIFSGAMTSAYMFYLLKDYDRALIYLKEVLPMIDSFGDERDIYTLYGDVLLSMGRDDEAVINYRKALEADGNDKHFSGTDIYLSYGKYLMLNNRYKEAIDIMKEGLLFSLKRNNTVNRYQLYYNISSSYEALGDMENSLVYYKYFHEEADSIFNIDKERAVSALRLQYEKEKYEKEIQQKKIVILKGQKRLQLTLLLLLIVVIILITGYLLYYRRNKYFQRILVRHQEMLDKERWYQQQIKEVSGNNDTQIKYINNNMSDEKAEKLFNQLQDLMNTEKIYRMHDLNRDKVARMLSTNRTYLTDVINKFTGLSFNYYINSFRIDEAIRELSDPDNDIPIKALSDNIGFSSLSTFYKFFNDIKGMPPAQFRMLHMRP